MLEEIHDIEYWKKEYLEISKDNDKLELELQQYKQQIDELNNSLEKINKIVNQYGVQTIPSGLGECTIEMPVYETNIIYNLSKLKERNEE